MIAAYAERQIVNHESGEDLLLRDEWRVVRLTDERRDKLATERGITGALQAIRYGEIVLERRRMRNGVAGEWEFLSTYPSRRAALLDIPSGAVALVAQLQAIQAERQKEAIEALEKHRQEEEERERRMRAFRGEACFQRMLEGSPTNRALAERWNRLVERFRSLPQDQRRDSYEGPLRDLSAAVRDAATIPSKAKAIRSAIERALVEFPHLEAQA